MKSKVILYFLIGITGFLVFESCSKDIPYYINPTEEPDRLSRALNILGSNKNGVFDFDKNFASFSITENSESATVTSDNFLYIPLAFSGNVEVEHIYFQVEGANNHWVVPIEDNSSTTSVFAVGIPENILEGEFDITYQLLAKNGTVSNTASTHVTIILPEAFCENGKAGERVAGEDGITVRTYDLGNQSGWVTIRYEMFTKKDRMDIRYKNKWIRSTGDLLRDGESEPPTGWCSSVGAEEGFVSGNNEFSFFYDPDLEGTLSRKIDIYVSGCLQGGTEWWFEVDCPDSSKPVLGIHSTVNGNSAALPTTGHSWLSLTQNGETQYIGLWADEHADVPNEEDSNGNTVNDFSDIRINQESGIGEVNRYYSLNEFQVQKLGVFLSEPRYWALNYNCASFASELATFVTGENIDARENVLGATVETPRKLIEIIKGLESETPSNSYAPPGVVEDSSSCSFCF